MTNMAIYCSNGRWYRHLHGGSLYTSTSYGIYLDSTARLFFFLSHQKTGNMEKNKCVTCNKGPQLELKWKLRLSAVRLACQLFFHFTKYLFKCQNIVINPHHIFPEVIQHETTIYSIYDDTKQRKAAALEQVDVCYFSLINDFLLL